jgi:uncharacterized protein HemY
MRFNRAELLFQKGRMDESLAEYRRSMTLAEILRHRTRIADIYVEMGRVNMAAKQWQAALACFEAGYNAADANRPSSHAATTCDRLADVHDALGNADEAARQRARATRERESFDRESAHAREALEAFWREHEADKA